MDTAKKMNGSSEKSETNDFVAFFLPNCYEKLLSRIIKTFDDRIVRAYCKVRFIIININILHILSLCLRGKCKILEIGCGFGLYGLYLSSLFPEISYCGYDINSKRVEMANLAARRLGLQNIKFKCQDARVLRIDEKFDAIVMIDLLHHLDNNSKSSLLEMCSRHLTCEGRLVIKEVTTHPFWKLAFTWTLDVLMTRGFQIWYLDEMSFNVLLRNHFSRINTFPIADWLPYSHIVYLCENI